MSTILKALKKSEADRQLGRAPRLGELPQVTDSLSRSTSAQHFVTALLGVVALGLVVYLLWPDSSELPTTPQQAQRINQTAVPAPQQNLTDSQPSSPKPKPPAAAETQTAAAKSETPEPVPRVPSPESRNPAPDSESSLQNPATPPDRTDTKTPRADTPAARPRSNTPDLKPLRKYALLPRYRGLSQARRDALPALTLNVLMYADDPSRRFVLINLERYAEGDWVSDELQVVEIISGGVVLQDADGQFVLPRP